MQQVQDAAFVQRFIRCGYDGYQQNWHERNGGNLSYRVKPEEINEIKHLLRYDAPLSPIGTKVQNLARECFLVTGSGKYMRNLPLDPEANIALVEVDDSGEQYRLLWGLRDGGRPTSELPTHLMNHQVKKRQTNGAHRVIYHAHPANLIALTFVLPLESEAFTRELWEIMTECPVIFPQGLGVVRWMVPGGRDIAVETSVLMEQFDAVVWAHHGLFCSGEDFDAAFGLMHCIEKASEILVKVLSIRPDKRSTIEPDDFRALARDFNLTLPEKYLYDKHGV